MVYIVKAVNYFYNGPHWVRTSDPHPVKLEGLYYLFFEIMKYQCNPENYKWITVNRNNQAAYSALIRLRHYSKSTINIIFSSKSPQLS